MKNYIRKVQGDPAWALARASCEQDDPTSLARAISETTDPDDLDDLLHYALMEAIRANSLTVATYILEHGGSTRRLQPLDVANHGRTSKPVLELLLRHGWDINTSDPASPLGNDKPLLWHFAHLEDMVAWCLAHGAAVRPRGMEPLKPDSITRPQAMFLQILERVAKMGSVASFKLLRSKGAPLGWRPLHLAAEAATHFKPPPAPQKEAGLGPAENYADRMAMVRYLVDELRLDVNAPDLPPGAHAPMHYGAPLCYVALNPMKHDTRELVWYLLDHGADPAEAIKIAERDERPDFVRDVEEWKEKRAKSSLWRRCRVQ